jgi:UDP-GlcNAc:undecaprenyl-phosphate/decaprenyl-phosphate GlcNAc-1-phosphate transferase
MKKGRSATYIMDFPNERSLHSAPIPRVGGLGVAVGLACCAALQSAFAQGLSSIIVSLLSAYLALLLISLIDDIFSLSVAIRLIAHITVISTWIYVAVPIDHKFAAIVGIFLMLGIAWAMNLYNFMDGADGLAGSMTIVGFSAYAFASYLMKDWSLLLTCAGIVSATLGFLYFNFPPAKVFLGDSGSIPLGFMAAAIGTIGVQSNYWPMTFPFMLFAMFWVDATFTLAKRLFQRKKIWHAHREHWYQLAIIGGTSHRRVLLIHLGCNAFITFLAISTLSYNGQFGMAFHATTMLLTLGVAIGFGSWAQRRSNLAKSA